MVIGHIFCVGRNFRKHAAEMGSDAPEKPMVFQKPAHSLACAGGDVLRYPNDCGAIHYEVEIVLYIGKQVKEGFSVDEVVTDMALGIDMTMRDVQSELKQKGHPWLLAKGFKNAAVVTDFWSFPGVHACKEKNFSLYKNDECVQKGNIKDLIFDFQTLLTYIHEHIGLNQGDVVYTGTPEGVGPLSDHDTFELFWGTKRKGQFRVQLGAR